MAEKQGAVGHVVQVIGPVLDFNSKPATCRKFSTQSG